jgi:predicted peptidase
MDKLVLLIVKPTTLEQEELLIAGNSQRFWLSLDNTVFFKYHKPDNMTRISVSMLTIISCCLLCFSNCKPEEPELPAIRTYTDIQEDFANINIAVGVHDESIEFVNNINWNFRVIAPDIVAGEMYPLVIHLHGASGGSEDAHKATECYAEPGFEDLETFILSPNGGSLLWNAFENQEMVINLILLARDFWPVDPDKIVVTGYSNGGNGSWFFGETQPELFSAAIPMASSYSTIHTDGSTRLMPIPMYCIHGENDELFPLAETEEWINQTINVGSDVTFVVAEGLGHYEPCSYVDYLKDAVTWLTDVVWQ